MILDFIAVKRISKLLSKLPSDDLLLSIKTLEQVQHLMGYRLICKSVALTLAAKFHFHDDPLILAERTGKIPHRYAERIRSMTLYIERLWGLVQATAPYIEDEFKKSKLDCPFNSAFELFQAIITHEVNADFRLCLKPYHEFSADKYEKNLRNAGKLVTGENLKSPVKSKLYQFASQLHRNPLLTSVLLIAEQKSSRSEFVKAALEDYYTHQKRMWNAEARAWRYRKSFVWKDGKKYYGTKTGGTYNMS